MKKISHGVCSCICVETNVIIKIDYTKINIDEEHWVQFPTTHQAGIIVCFLYAYY